MTADLSNNEEEGSLTLSIKGILVYVLLCKFVVGLSPSKDGS